MDDGYTVAELPDIRSLLVGELSRPPHANAVLFMYALHARAGLQVPADPAIGNSARQAQLLVRHELARLGNRGPARQQPPDGWQGSRGR
jgi:hypothetical protein